MADRPTRGLVCFDLDGVIADSRDGILYCINLALADIGVSALPPEEVGQYIGPPLIHGFREMLMGAGLDPARAAGCVATYRRAYGAESLSRTRAFPGITDALERVAGIARVALVTSKLEVFARPLLASLRADQWIESIFSPRPEADDEPKAETLSRAIETMRAREGTVVMVGDRSHDVVAAVANDAVPIGVLWGFGSREELEGAGATLVAETPEELIAMVGRVIRAPPVT